LAARRRFVLKTEPTAAAFLWRGTTAGQAGETQEEEVRMIAVHFEKQLVEQVLDAVKNAKPIHCDWNGRNMMSVAGTLLFALYTQGPHRDRLPGIQKVNELPGEHREAVEEDFEQDLHDALQFVGGLAMAVLRRRIRRYVRVNRRMHDLQRERKENYQVHQGQQRKVNAPRSFARFRRFGLRPRSAVAGVSERNRPMSAPSRAVAYYRMSQDRQETTIPTSHRG
jgi:hypothetical protein